MKTPTQPSCTAPDKPQFAVWPYLNQYLRGDQAMPRAKCYDGRESWELPSGDSPADRGQPFRTEEQVLEWRQTHGNGNGVVIVGYPGPSKPTALRTVPQEYMQRRALIFLVILVRALRLFRAQSHARSRITPRFLLLEREVEIEYRPQMLAALQSKVDACAGTARGTVPVCPQCGQPMRCQDTREVSWRAHCGGLHAPVSRYRCPPCHYECRPLLDLLGVEPGRISGALTRLLALLATVAPYPLAARLAWLLLGVRVSPMSIWRVAQRLGEAAAHHTDALSRYHADSRSIGAPTQTAPSAVVLGVDGCSLGMQVRSTRRRRQNGEPLPPLPPVEDGHFREVKTGVLLLPSERVETSPGRRSVVRRF